MATPPSADTVDSAPSIVKGALHHTTHDPNVMSTNPDDSFEAGAVRYKPWHSRNCPGRQRTPHRTQLWRSIGHWRRGRIDIGPQSLLAPGQRSLAYSTTNQELDVNCLDPFGRTEMDNGGSGFVIVDPETDGVATEMEELEAKSKAGVD
eukprot:scaffold16758_cov57-Attheya_sp.AAC.4